MRFLIIAAVTLAGSSHAADSSSETASTPVSIPKIVVSAPVWRTFGFSVSGRPKFLVPRRNAKFARLSVGKSVAKGSPADKAGLKPGDIIETIDGVPASDMTLLDVDRKLFGKKIGDRVVLVVRSPAEKQSRKVELVIE